MSTKLVMKIAGGGEFHSGMVKISRMKIIYININYLKWAIRSQDPKIDIDKIMDKVQRLDVSGSEMISHHQ